MDRAGYHQPKTILLLGGASCVWGDFKAARERVGLHDVAAVNDAGVAYSGKLRFWATLHPGKFSRWQRLRRNKGFDDDYIAVGRDKYVDTRIDKVVNEIWPGSSGLYAVQIAAIAFGYQQIICCGIPMDPEKPHFFSQQPWKDATNYHKGWREAVQQPELKGKVQSMSGWTKALLDTR